MGTLQADSSSSIDPLILELEGLVEAGAVSEQSISELTVEPVTSEELAELLPRYEVGALVGAGGMGQVYDARDTLLQRRVAIKVVGRPGPLVADLMRREREVLAVLDHPGIVAVYDCGELSHGRPYYVMQYVEGEELLAYAQSRRLDRQQVVALMAEVARAVGVAHLLKIVHRDLKPSNIQVTSQGRPMILDFGLAKFAAASESEPIAALEHDSLQTVSVGKIKGTLAYMSPEQATGEAVDSRTDVYALGVILYQLLTGRLPRDPQLERSSPLEWGERLRNAPAELECAFGRGVSCSLRAIVMRCLQSDPERRYPNAGDLASDLDAVLTGRPVAAVQRFRALHLIRSFAQRNRRALFIAAMILVVLVTTVAMAFVRVREERNLAERSAARELAERRRAIDRENATRRFLYAADMGQAHRLWHDQQVDRAQALLDRYQVSDNEDDLRSFEWQFLSKLCLGRPLTLAGHSDEATALQYSPDAARLISGDAAGNVQLWDSARGTLLAAFSANRQPIRQVGFAPENRAYSLGADRILRIWDVETGREIGKVAWLFRSVAAAAWSPDGQQIALLDSGGWIYLWDAQSLKMVGQKFAHPSKGGRSLCFSPDSKFLASGGKDDSAKVWDVRTWDKVAELGPHLGPIDSLRFSSDGQLLATGGVDRILRVWRLEAPESPLMQWVGPDSIVAVGFGAADDTLWAACKNGTVNLLETSGSHRETFRTDPTRLQAVAVSEDLSLVASTSGDDSVQLWRAEQLAERRHISHSDSAPTAIVNMAAGTQLLIPYSQQAYLDLLDARTLEFRTRLMHPEATLTTAVCSQAGDCLLTLDSSGGVDRWQNGDGRRTRLLTGSGELRLAMAANPREPSFAVADATGTLGIYDVLTGEKLVALKGHDGMPIVSATYSNDGRLLASTGWDKTVHLWDVAEGKLISVLRGHQGVTHQVSFRPDDRQIASTSADGTVRLWDLARNSEVTTLWRQPYETKGICFSPDGLTLAAGNSAHSHTGRSQVRTWNLATLQETLTLDVGASEIVSLQFASDGSRLMAAVRGGACGNGIVVWEAEPSATVVARQQEGTH